MGVRTRVGAGVIVVLVAALLTGCVGPITYGKNTVPRDKYGVSHHGPQPTARTQDGDVEVWDLTGVPSAKKYGIDAGTTKHTHVGAYSSGEPRKVRLMLADGKAVTMHARDLIFDYWDADTTSTDSKTGEVLIPAGRHFQLQVSGWVTEDPDEAVRRHRSVITQLGLSQDSVTKLQHSIASTFDPLDAKSAGGSDAFTTSDDTVVSVSTNFRTAIEQKYRTFHTDAHVYWHEQPLP
ncbi:hypothetical protein [Curtobacterium sp. MCSS17_016]|uniref:hypothetical protein n=1 Tax=Curtobacterium sp. MCSS17_016 TaxID=2175644 RepID=UPI0011B48BF3|nr:hypothetical protein [Curtobacterium sp. MCSS17_016]WIE81395.1 hypothetical protein DEJ19_019360 [Curtobacterium sp. MCSS17_016]